MRTTLRHNEKILLITKKHWIVLGTPLMLLLAASVFLVTFPPQSISLNLSVGNISLIFLIGAAVYLVYAVYERKFNIWVVTNHRIIDEWGVLNANTKESLLDKINNVACRQTLVARMMDYGDIEIQTAAEQGATLYTYVTAPKVLHEIIVEASQAYSKGLFAEQNKDIALVNKLSDDNPEATNEIKSDITSKTPATTVESDITSKTSKTSDISSKSSEVSEADHKKIVDPRSWRKNE